MQRRKLRVPDSPLFRCASGFLAGIFLVFAFGPSDEEKTNG